MTDPDVPIPKPTGLKGWLSQPSTGPSISLVVLAVALLSLWYNVATYNRQGDRWAAEANAMYQLNGNVEPFVTSDGNRIAGLAFYRGREPMRVQKLEIISPTDATFALASGRKALAPLKTEIIFDDIGGRSVESAHRFELAIRSPRTPGSDQGEVIEIEGTAIGLTGDKMTVVRRAQIMVPPTAAKTP